MAVFAGFRIGKYLSKSSKFEAYCVFALQHKVKGVSGGCEREI